ncbi:MAG: hypothetical protein QW272_08320 [Candidatus Methanomethylicaceae archaeon]
MNKEEFLERLKDYEENIGKPLEFSLTEEIFSVNTYIFNEGYSYFRILQEYYNYALDIYDNEIFLTIDWLKEILEKLKGKK